MDNVVIRQANRNDALAIHKLHTQSVTELCKDYYSGDQIHGWIDHRTPEGYYSAIDQQTYFVAIIDSQIVGFGEAVPGEVRAVYVSPNHINKGIGSILLDHAMKIALTNDKVLLESTLNAVGFYDKKGFVEVERRSTCRGNINIPCVFMEFKSSRQQ